MSALSKSTWKEKLETWSPPFGRRGDWVVISEARSSVGTSHSSTCERVIPQILSTMDHMCSVQLLKIIVLDSHSISLYYRLIPYVAGLCIQLGRCKAIETRDFIKNSCHI